MKYATQHSANQRNKKIYRIEYKNVGESHIRVKEIEAISKRGAEKRLKEMAAQYLSYPKVISVVVVEK